ncbi:MAG: alpha/beta hydrolase [Pseudomonadales bacterium]|nr:alpha/beta hydrolase [Pseudomonadales bacterium]
MIDFPAPEMMTVNGVELAVHQAGAGGIPVVLCHGWPELAYSWRYQVPALVAAGYHVIAPDQRGYGDSSKPEDVQAYDIHHLTGDHVALLDALGIEKAVYVGHDWGAIVVWNHALLHPERVMGVANLSVPFRPREPADPLPFWEQMLGPDFYIVHFNRQPGVAAAAFQANTDRFLRNLYRTRQWLEAKTAEPDGQSIVALATASNTAGELMMSEEELSVFTTAFRKGGFHAPCNWYRNFSRNWETTADVEQLIRQPALMIYGSYDMVPKTDMSATVPDLEIHEFECGHWIQQEMPQETNAVLLSWLEKRMKPLFS